MYACKPTNSPDNPGGDSGSSTTNKKENGHEYVDLGLSVKWATMNIGASNPETSGYYFAWGATSSQSNYTLITYFDYKEQGMKKYNSKGGKSNLATEDDAATANWGGTWRMPTRAETEELLAKCSWKWTTLNGVNGCQVTGPNGKSIFLPAAGYRDGSSSFQVGTLGRYWSSSLDNSNDYGAYFMGFSESGNSSDTHARYCGHPVRAVCK